MRNVFCSNYMGDGFAVASGGPSNSIDPDGVRIYGNTFINGGRHCITPLGSNLDFYANRFERNTSHISDLETSGSGVLFNHLYRNNLFVGARGDGMRTPTFAGAGTKQCDAHGTFLRGCAWVENARWYTTLNTVNINYGAISIFPGALDLGWKRNIVPNRTVTNCTTTIGSHIVSSPNFGLTLRSATWQGEYRAAISGPGIPAGSYIDDILSTTQLRFIGPGGASATATSSTATLQITCIAAPYGSPTNVGPDHASLGEHEGCDLYVIRNMWSRNTGVTYALGGDLPNGYQGPNHEGGATGWSRALFQYNYGPTQLGDPPAGLSFLNTTNIFGTHMTSIAAQNPGLFEQPTP